MKTKIVVLVGIALCAMLLISPALASSANSNILEIYGNANEDDTIDMRDLTYVKLIFFGKKPETELSDAKYDGKINPLDFIQIKLIIVGKEKELTILDDTITDTYPNGKPVTVKKPIERIILLHRSAAQAIKVLNAEDNVVGVELRISKRNKQFPELSKLPCVDKKDIEAIISLSPDLVLTIGGPHFSEMMDDRYKNLPPSMPLVKLQFYEPDIMAEDMAKLGYMLGKVEEAKEYIDFEDNCMSTINERVGELSEDEKPRVYSEWGYKPYGTYSKGSSTHQACIVAGGINIAADLPGTYPTVDPEWVIVQNPDIIFKGLDTKELFHYLGYEADDPSEIRAMWEEVMNRPELANIAAVKNERVYLISNELLGVPSYFVGITYMAKWFHPDLFEDLDPQAIHQEYLTEFQGLDYDLDKHGVFVYPPLKD